MGSIAGIGSIAREGGGAGMLRPARDGGGIDATELPGGGGIMETGGNSEGRWPSS
jgi:hypothetical protein